MYNRLTVIWLKLEALNYVESKNNNNLFIQLSFQYGTYCIYINLYRQHIYAVKIQKKLIDLNKTC